ncbi:MAG: asparagine synthetase B family protein, partial [Aggregatilineales bacterium]
MCGIAGYINLTGEPASERILRQMNDTLIHRGPDGEGYFVRDNVGLAMRRLSIIDLAGSDQPLYNEDKSIAMVFNGEIYNYRRLREQLLAKGHQFRTDGDGETIIHRYEEPTGIDDLRGHFAFGLWDDNKKQLTLRRDYTGQKPLYYYHGNKVFVFASEIKAILKHPAVLCESTLNSPETLSLYLSYGYIPAPQTAFKNIKMLLPGHQLSLQNNNLTINPFWQPPALSDDDTQLSEQDITL